MKLLSGFAWISIMLLCIGCQAPAGKINTEGYATYGAPAQPSGVMTLGEAVAKAETLGDKPVCVKATVHEVCQHRGCWMIVTDGKEKVRVRFTASPQCTDGFYVPRNATGHEVYATGSLEQSEIPETQLRHWAIEAGKSKEEIDKISGPQKEYVMVATSVMISDGSKLEKVVE